MKVKLLQVFPRWKKKKTNKQIKTNKNEAKHKA